MRRYQAVARAMGADPLEVLATAAVRDAANGAEFVRRLAPHLPGVPIRILSGVGGGRILGAGCYLRYPGGGRDPGRNWRRIAGAGSVAGWPAGPEPYGGVGRDPAGGARGQRSGARAGHRRCGFGWGWLAGQGEGRDLYLVGGAWRALARVHMSQVGYPLHMVHHYTIGREEARELAGMIAGSGGVRWNGCRACRAGASRTCPTPPWCCAGCCGRRPPRGWCSARTGCERAGSCSGSRMRCARGPAACRWPRLCAVARAGCDAAARSDSLDRAVVPA